MDLIYAPQVKTVRVKSILTAIKQLMATADEIIIATDFDRDGELIGMETVKYAEADMSKVKRARFSALTKGEVEAAFDDLTLPDERLAAAAEARQIIDLSWGAVLTRLISLSSGQVGKSFMSNLHHFHSAVISHTEDVVFCTPRTFHIQPFCQL